MIDFTDQTNQEIEQILSRYPTKQAALLPVLWCAHREFGQISSEVIDLVAKRLGLSPAHVYGVVTFYTMYQTKPIGKHHIQVCQTLPCALMGCERIVDQITKRLGIQVGETTEDRCFTLSTVECLASCDTAPVMMVNEKYYENLTEEEVDRILADLKEKK